MLDELSEREQKEVVLALLYATWFAHGTAGHNSYMTLAKVARQAGYRCKVDGEAPVLHRHNDNANAVLESQSGATRSSKDE